MSNHRTSAFRSFGLPVFIGLATLAFIALGATSVKSVPRGHIAVTGQPGEARSVLEPGLHLVSPFTPVDFYPEGIVAVEGRGTALTQEGASIDVDFILRAGPDRANAAALPRRVHSGSAADVFSAELEKMVQRALEEPGRNADTTIESHLRSRLGEWGLHVESLEIGESLRAPTLDAGARSIPEREPLEHPLLLIGIDGADWQILDPLIEAGRLPNLEALKQNAAVGHMRSFEPILSPLLWTTAVTGKSPDEHGIIDFLVNDPVTGRRAPISSRSRRVRALWNIFTERGLSVDVIAWWASWPAEGVNGRIVSDRVAYSLFDVDAAQTGLTYPRALWNSIGPQVVDDEEIGYDRVHRFLDITPGEFTEAREAVVANPQTAYKQPINHLTKILASTQTYHGIALSLLKKKQPDLFAVYYQGIDEVSHRFMHFAPPKMAMVSNEEFDRYHRAVEEFYVYQDELLGELLATASPSSRIMVISDHGFHNGPSRPTDGPADIEGKPGKWHRLYGVVMIAGEGIPPSRFDTATLYDVTPTLLALAGLPGARDMRGEPLLRSPAGTGVSSIASYEEEPGGVTGSPRPEEVALISEADEELLRNLASLGYIGSVETGSGEDGSGEPGSVTAHTNMASLLLQKGDLGGAETELTQALEIQPGYFPAMMGLAQVHVRRGEIEEALVMTRTAIGSTREPEQGAYLQLVLLAIRAGQAPQAANFLRALRERRPSSQGIETGLGMLAEESGRFDEADARYRAALEMEPVGTDAMGRLFLLYRRAGREEELEDEVRGALAINERSVLHRNWMGLILQRHGDLTGAEAQFKAALEISPDFGGSMANLGSLYGRIGRLEEAVTVLDRAVRIEPRNIEAQVNLGAALAKLGRLDDAIARLEDARRMGMKSPELLNAVGLAYAQSGRKEPAVEALEESLTLLPDQPQVRALLAELTQPA